METVDANGISIPMVISKDVNDRDEELVNEIHNKECEEFEKLEDKQYDIIDGIKKGKIKTTDGKVIQSRKSILDFGIGTAYIEVATNGLQGGDYGHGGRASVRVSFDGFVVTKMDAHLTDSYDNDGKIEIEVGGDVEINALSEIFHYIANELDLLIEVNENK